MSTYPPRFRRPAVRGSIIRRVSLALALAGVVSIGSAGAGPDSGRRPNAKTVSGKDSLRKSVLYDRLRGAPHKRDRREVTPLNKAAARTELLARFRHAIPDSKKWSRAAGLLPDAGLEQYGELMLARLGVASGQSLRHLPVGDEQTLANSADGLGRTLLVSSDVNGITRYDAVTGQFLGFFVPIEGGLTKSHMTWGPDGNLYVASNDGVLRYTGDNPQPLSDCFGLAPGDPCAGPNGAPGSDEFVPIGSGGFPINVKPHDDRRASQDRHISVDLFRRITATYMPEQ